MEKSSAVATKALRKGELFRIGSKPVIPLLLESDKGSFCGNCLKNLEIRECKVAYNQSIASYACPGECGEMFCSLQCKFVAIYGVEAEHSKPWGWHSFICSGIPAEKSAIVEFSKYCSRSSETFMLAAKLLAHLFSGALACQEDAVKFLSHFHKHFTNRHSWPDLAARTSLESGFHYCEFTHQRRILHEQLVEAWGLLESHFLNIFACHDIQFDVFLEFNMYADFVASVETMTYALNIVRRPTGSGASECANGFSQSYGNRLNHDTTHSPMLASTKHLDEDTIIEFSGLILGFDFIGLSHSCAPNVQLDLESLSLTQLSCIALRNIERGESLTIANIPLHQSLETRQLTLIQRFGLVCMCSRCCWEQGNILHCQKTFTNADMMSLATQAYEEGRFKDCLDVLNCIIINQPGDGDALHLYGVTMLSLGNWKVAHKIWRCAHVLKKDHYWLEKQAIKDSAYKSFDCGNKTADDIDCLTIKAGEVYMTSRTVVSALTCKNWVAAAERVAKAKGGWETDRHKVVSTTDLPVHEIPEILEDWNGLFATTIGPCLRQWYALAPGNNIHVHDAFVVKYDAMHGQCHLPIHTDQGQFSLTLALNGTEDYIGGGTVFPDFSCTVNPDCGKFIAFKSSTPHGGSPITFGLRYIIVAFLYIT